MIVGIGTDLVSVEELEHSVDEQPGRYAERIFTPHEIAEAKGRANPYQVLAARLATKEAVMKALGIGWNGDVDWLQMETRTDEAGKPSVILSGPAEALAKSKGITQIHISTSHTPLLASAFVVLEATATQEPRPAGD